MSASPVSPSRYRAHLQTTVASSAAPYGYTLTIWTTGAVTTHARGVPSTWEALLLLAGAVSGFAFTAALAHGSATDTFSTHEHRAIRLWAGFHLVSVGSAIGVAAAIAHVLESPIAWLAVGFAATVMYLLVAAAQFALAEQSKKREMRGGPPNAARRDPFEEER
jgi:hypothetical protein